MRVLRVLNAHILRLSGISGLSIMVSSFLDLSFYLVYVLVATLVGLNTDPERGEFDDRSFRDMWLFLSSM